MATGHPSSPYKGLRYYGPEDSTIFAARDKDATLCARLLTGRASVLMLHGRTGCGKSSFLRAALKPVLEQAATGLWFAGEAGGFRVVRSGLTPLRQIAGAVFDLVCDLEREKLASVDDVRAIRGDSKEREDYVDRCADNPDRMIESLTALGETAPGTPILVIDQAEEIYTLRDPVERGSKNRELSAARVDYMNLLRAITTNPLGVKILISLRTEYKGLFEDELRRGLSADASTQLTGFHLDDLDRDGLIEAIISPTKVPGPDGKTRLYRFEYKDKVPETIADRLLNPEYVPMGGVLPTLQVVCSRLYEQTRRSKTQNSHDTWEIRITDLERLGKLDNQVEVHLRERLEEMFLKLGPKARDSAATQTPGRESVETDRTADIDKWYALLEKLVRVQGDGRAVTSQLPEDDLKGHARKLKCRLADHGALEHLASDDVGILRTETRDGKKLWTLGHDSLGLAIRKWAVTYKEWLEPSMKMDMNSPRGAAKLTREELFPKDETLPSFTIGIPKDSLWDHQIPAFAHARWFGQRLGIHFKGDQTLDPTNAPASSPVLVASERAAFPPAGQRSAWTDIAVSDLFLGNGLVGPHVEGLLPLRTVGEIEDEQERADEMLRRLGKIIEYLGSVRAKVLSYDDSSLSMMRLAAQLSGKPGGDRARYVPRDNSYPGKDELFYRLIEPSQDNETVFMIGTAYGRALASHRGFVTYFDCKDLMKLMELLMKLDRGVDRSLLVDPDFRGWLFRLYQDSFFHTVWQINIPAADWKRIEHYPLVMRLAGLCYFTADYIRAFADDFVRHLYDWHANNFDPADQVSRETIREMLRDCFQFLTFEENPRLLFDPDSRFEFSPRAPKTAATDADEKLPSMVREIHVELTALRKRTVDLFVEMCRLLEQLERHNKNARRDETLKDAEELRRFAWENFRIHNYYDSARLMERALGLVGETVTKTTSEIWEMAGPAQAPAAVPAPGSFV